MTQNEIIELLQYANSVYPATRMTHEQITQTAFIWGQDLQKHSAKKVGEAFKYATRSSPDKMPSLPRILNAIDEIDMIPKPKSPEQEFRDTHCGKDPEEWERDEAWRNSEEGKKKIAWYYEQFDKLFGVKFSA